MSVLCVSTNICTLILLLFMVIYSYTLTLFITETEMVLLTHESSKCSVKTVKSRKAVFVSLKHFEKKDFELITTIYICKILPQASKFILLNKDNLRPQ